MEKEEKMFSAGVWIFGAAGDRFMLSGYRPDKSIQERIFLASEVEYLRGIELNYPVDVNEDNLEEVRKWLTEANLGTSMIGTELSGNREWGHGSLSSENREIRKKALQTVKGSMDMALALGADGVNLWLGQDGFDYCFQTNYARTWSYLVEGVKESALYSPEMRMCVEYKPKEPRTHSFIANAPRAMLLIQEVGLDNVGVTMDVGHAFNAGENAADSVALLNRYGKLFHLHLNDNFRAWDDDLIVGSVHLMEYIELLYWLEKTGYNGWYSLDLFPYREDPVKACHESIAMLRGMLRLLNRIGVEKLERHINTGNVTDTLALIREHLLP